MLPITDVLDNDLQNADKYGLSDPSKHKLLQGYNRQRMQRMTCEILNREEVVVENSGE
jgi:hypothetical protein